MSSIHAVVRRSSLAGLAVALGVSVTHISTVGGALFHSARNYLKQLQAYKAYHNGHNGKQAHPPIKNRPDKGRFFMGEAKARMKMPRPQQSGFSTTPLFLY